MTVSFCKFLKRTNHPAYGIAIVFISHAWYYLFLDVVDALEYHFREQPDIVIWFDLFSNNQHKTIDLDLDWWCNTFKSAIKSFGHTVMVLTPWDNPIPLQRGWCIFELYCTAETNSVFEVAMSEQQQQQKFFNDMKPNADNEIRKMLGLVNLEQSECFKEEDRQRIFDAIRKTGGIYGINSMVCEQMGNFYIMKMIACMSMLLM